ncbi:MAG: hypothetical protein ACMUIS_09575 [bacterium]
MSFDANAHENRNELKKLFKRLGEVINDNLSHSEEVQEILHQIRILGMGVDLSMVIGLGLYSHADGTHEILFDSDEEEIRFELTSADRAFLDQYKLKLIMDATETAEG